jgi:hypothetical protein
MVNIYEAQASNKRKSFLVVLGYVIFVTLAVYVLARALGTYYGYQAGTLGCIGFHLFLVPILQ